jgi:NADPH-dependent 2,4-dienoyl-CoA reductase/sulfur reductase-like enzyme
MIWVNYDKLILTTGATPVMPPVPGSDLTGITTLQSMRDADYLRKIRDEQKIKKAVIIGGGLIGMETSEALQLAGMDITIIELLPQLLTFLDWEMAKLVENHVRSKDANVITENGLVAFLGEDGKLTGVKLSNGTELPCELAVVAVGVRPNAKLAREAGLQIGETGGITVNEHMQTSDPDIYAAGDCVEINNLITGKKVHAPYGDLANLQGRVAGENAAMATGLTFSPGTILSGSCKIFDYSQVHDWKKNSLQRLDIRTLQYSKMPAPTSPTSWMGKMIITKLVVAKTIGDDLGALSEGRPVMSATDSTKGPWR